MIQQVNGSGIMETKKKESGKMSKRIANVRKKLIIYDLLILTLFDDSLGKLF